MSLIEHELPNHELVKLLSLRREQLEITEIQLAEDSPSAGRLVREVEPAAGARLISVTIASSSWSGCARRGRRSARS